MPSKNKVIVTVEPGKQELFITREFDAPRELVYKAHIDPKLYVQWLGPHGYKMVLETFEPVSGGRYRYIQKDTHGNEAGFHGCFHEISEELMIQTFEFEGLPERGHVILDTMRLEELPGNRTRVTIQSVFQSVEDRDGMVKAGMEKGVREGYERLDDILAGMR
ncbi:MAG: SRPBCC family protein [Anaerolineales bacterium]|nr:SRPBCC family protein [Anaerolineales bacterium]GJQ35325.1 MAG: ATPase [Anaerolineaceae bacterium]